MKMDEGTIGLIFAAAIVAFSVGVWARKRAFHRRARNWPIAQGEVASTDLSFQQDASQAAASRYVGTVNYVYRAHGQPLSGKLKKTFLRRGSAEAWISRFSKGQALIVRYSPDDLRLSTIFEEEQRAEQPASHAQ